MSPDPSSDARGLLDVRIERADDLSVVTLEGELDVSSVNHVRTTLGEVLIDAASRSRVIVDLADLSFMDSVGLGALVRAQRKARVLRTRFDLVCPEGNVRRLLAITGMLHVFSVYDSLDSALAGPRS